MAILYKTDGTIIDVTPENKKCFSLKELQGFVGGYIEIIPLMNGKEYMVVNEEGKLNGLDENSNATDLLGERIVGNALIGNKVEIG